MASKQQNKRTFTSQTFEIEEKKVPLVFGLDCKLRAFNLLVSCYKKEEGQVYLIF